MLTAIDTLGRRSLGMVSMALSLADARQSSHCFIGPRRNRGVSVGVDAD